MTAHRWRWQQLLIWFSRRWNKKVFFHWFLHLFISSSPDGVGGRWGTDASTRFSFIPGGVGVAEDFNKIRPQVAPNFGGKNSLDRWQHIEGVTKSFPWRKKRRQLMNELKRKVSGTQSGRSHQSSSNRHAHSGVHSLVHWPPGNSVLKFTFSDEKKWHSLHGILRVKWSRDSPELYTGAGSAWRSGERTRK